MNGAPVLTPALDPHSVELLEVAIGVGVAMGLLVALAVICSLALVDLAHRESYADGHRPFARWRFPQAHRQAVAERRVGYRTPAGRRDRA